MNENNENINNNENENAEEVIHEEEEFEDVWGYNEAENNEAENIKEENIMNNQNTQNQNNVNELNNINVNGMTNDELKQLKKKINAEQAARTPSWKKWVKRIALGLGIAGGVAGVGYGVKQLIDSKKTDVDSCCGNNSVDIDTEASKWGVDIA